MSEEQFEADLKAAEEEEQEVQPEVQEEVQEEEVTPEVVAKDQYDSIHKAMDQARHDKRELQDQFTTYKAEMEQKFARADERLTTMKEMWGGEEESDPQTKMSEQMQSQSRELEELREQQKIITLQNTLNSQEAEFASRTSDYNAAKEHYFSARRNSLQKLGYSSEQAQNQIAMETVQFAQTALAQNENAAARLYEASKELGYVPVTAQAQDKLKTIEEGQSVSTMPKGSTPKGELTIESLANMSQEEFNALTEEQMRRAMGG